MFYRLNKNSFVRTVARKGYIYSQLTKHDLVFDEVGAVFLQTLSRTACSFEQLFDKLLSSFINPPIETVRADFKEFLEMLSEYKYLTKGESAEACDNNEIVFSYRTAENIKTETEHFKQDLPWATCGVDSTKLFSDEHRKNPRIHGCQIEINNLCNERCIHCYIPHHLKTKRLNKLELFSVLEQLHEMGTLSLTLSGGEPLLHPDFIPLLFKARELDFSINILSNLTCLNADNLKAIKDCNVSFVQTSLYSMVPEEHDHITQLKGSHIKTMAAIEKLIEADVPVQISCPTMRSNYTTYKEVIKWAQKRRLKAQTDYVMMARTDFSSDNLDERLTLEETAVLLRDMLEADESYKEMLGEYKPSDPEKIKHDFMCGAGIDSICVSADGYYYPCSGWQGYPVGTISERLCDVWEKSPALLKIRNIRRGDFKKCMQCKDRDFCNACLVRNFNENGGDMFKVSKHFCEVAALNHRLANEFCAECAK